MLWATSEIKQPALESAEKLYGYVGHNNGNLAFVAGARLLFEEEVVFAPWHTSPDKLKELGDIVYIPCANQLGPHTDLGGLADNLEKAGIPVIGVGLGAQTRDIDTPVQLTQGTERWVRVMSSLCKGKNNILTRGSFTSSFLDSLGITTHLPSACPSLFINSNPYLHEDLIQNSCEIPRSIAACGGHQSWRNIRHIERQLISLVSDSVYPGSYIVQSMKDMMKISLGDSEVDSIEPEILERIISFTRPEMSPPEFKNWCSRYAHSFYDVGSWMFHLKRHDFVIGARYHGTALGIQAGVPSLCITIDSRTNELCQSSRIPFISADEIQSLDRQSIHQYFKSRFKPASFYSNRRSKANQYVNFLRSNGLTPSQHISSIANAPDPNTPLETSDVSIDISTQ